MRFLLPLVLLGLTGCETIRAEVTPERCESALDTAETVEGIAQLLVTFGYEAEKARALAAMIQQARDAIGLVCAQVG